MTQLILEMKRNQDIQRANLNTGTSDVPATDTPTATPPTIQGVSLLLDEPVDLSLATGLIEPVLLPVSVPVDNDISQSLPPTIQGLTGNQGQGPVRPSKPSYLQGEPKIDAATSQPVSTSIQPVTSEPPLVPVSVQPVDTIITGPVSPGQGGTEDPDVTNNETETDAAFITIDAESVRVPITSGTEPIPPLVSDGNSTDLVLPPPITVGSNTSPFSPVVSNVGPGQFKMLMLQIIILLSHFFQ